MTPLLTRIIHHACALVEVRHGSIGLYDREVNGFRITATHGIARNRIGQVLGPGVGVAGRLLETRRPIVEENYAAVPGAWPEIARDHVMGVPIVRGRRLLGFFAVGVRPPRRFTQSDVTLLSLFARHAAVAIVNAQAFEREHRKAERLRLITRVSRSITAGLDLGDLLQRTAGAIHAILSYPGVALSLVDEKRPDTLFLRGFGGDFGTLRPGAHRQAISQGVAGAAIREKVAQLVPDVRKDPRYIAAPGPRGMRSELAVPILLGGKALGVINVEGKVTFSKEDTETLQLVADHLAPAIRDASLFEREKLRAKRLSLISRIAQIVATGLDRKELLQRAADSIHALLGFENIDIPMLDAQRPEILVFGARGGGHANIRIANQMHISRGIIGAAAREGRPQIVNDVASDPRYVSPPLNPGCRAELAVPIIRDGRVLGVLNVEGAGPFDEDDAASLQIVADHLAVAVHNAELHESARRDAAYRERQRLLRDLHDSVTQLIFSLSLLAQSLAPAWRRSSEEGERKVARMVELSADALAEMRTLVGALYPPAAEPSEGGAVLRLPSRLRELARSRPDGAPKPRFFLKGWVAQEDEIEVILYRVAQEALANAWKHSGARSIDVTLAFGARRIGLTVADDGKGFFPPALRNGTACATGGLGLRIMEARVRERGGRLTIRSRPGKGTTVRLSFKRT